MKVISLLFVIVFCGCQVYGLEKEVLKNGLHHPCRLVLDYVTKYLFFSYESDEGKHHQVGFLNLQDNEFKPIPEVHDGHATAIDRKNHVVYFGGRDGLYKFDFDSKKGEKLTWSSDHIHEMFFKNQLYYVKHPEKDIYVVKDGVSQRISESDRLKDIEIDAIAVDDSKNFWFSNSTGIFYYKNNSHKVFNLGDYKVTAFTSDIKGNIFFSTKDGIYYVNHVKRTFDKLVKAENINSVVIENESSFIYATDNSIVRAKSVNLKDLEGIKL